MPKPASTATHPRGRKRALWLLLALSVAYLCTWAFSAQLALILAWLGQARSEAALTSSITAFIAYPALVLWLFCSRRPLRNALCLTALALAALAGAS